MTPAAYYVHAIPAGVVKPFAWRSKQLRFFCQGAATKKLYSSFSEQAMRCRCLLSLPDAVMAAAVHMDNKQVVVPLMYHFGTF